MSGQVVSLISYAQQQCKKPEKAWKSAGPGLIDLFFCFDILIDCNKAADWASQAVFCRWRLICASPLVRHTYSEKTSKRCRNGNSNKGKINNFTPKSIAFLQPKAAASLQHELESIHNTPLYKTLSTTLQMHRKERLHWAVRCTTKDSRVWK